MPGVQDDRFSIFPIWQKAKIDLTMTPEMEEFADEVGNPRSTAPAAVALPTR